MSRRPGVVAGLWLAAGITVGLTGCSGQPDLVPTIGSPSPVASISASAQADRATVLREQWKLTGMDLPNDWPDVPVPYAAHVTSAYAIGAPPRRTWTAVFLGDRGTTAQMVAPLNRALVAAGFAPVSAYEDPAGSSAGLYSFMGPQYAVYLVLGDQDGQPNMVMTVRGRTPADEPTPSATPTPISPVPTSPATPTAPATP